MNLSDRTPQDGRPPEFSRPRPSQKCMTRRIALDAQPVKAGLWVLQGEVQAKGAAIAHPMRRPPQRGDVLSDGGLEAVEI